MPVRLWWGGREVRVVLGHGRVPARGGARPGRGRALFTAWSDHVDVALGLGLTPSSYGLFKKLALRGRGAGAVLPEGAGRAGGGAAAAGARRWATLAAPALALGLRLRFGARSARRPADVERARRSTAFGGGVRRAVGARARARTRCACGATPPTSSGSTRRCPHRRYDAARGAPRAARSSASRSAGIEDYRGLRLGWIVDLFADAARRRREGRAARRACSDALPRARAWRARRPSAMNVAAGRRPAPPRLPAAAARPMQFCVRSRGRTATALRGPRALARDVRRQRHGPMSAHARPPCWSASTPRPTTSGRPRGRRALAVRNAERLPALQALFDALRRAADLPGHARDGHARRERAPCCASSAPAGRCEIGAHLHPWSSPPFRPEDLAGHTYPAQPARRPAGPPAHRADRRRSRSAWACGPPPTARAATASTGARCRSSSGSATRWTPAWTRCSTSGARAGMIVRGRAARALPPRLRGRARGRAASRILEIPITAATAARAAEGAGAALRAAAADPLARARSSAWACARSGCVRRTRRCRTCSPSPRGCAARARALLQHHLPLQRAAARRQPLHAGRSPAWTRFLDDLRALLEHLTGRLGAVGRTYAEFAARTGRERAPHERADGDAAPAAPPGGQRAPARTCSAQGLRARGHAVRFLTFGDEPRRATASSYVRRRARGCARTRLPQALEAAETWWKAAAAACAGATWCTSTPAPG